MQHLTIRRNEKRRTQRIGHRLRYHSNRPCHACRDRSINLNIQRHMTEIRSAWAIPGLITHVTVTRISEVAAKSYHVLPEEILKRTRRQEYKEPRHITMFLAHKHLGMSQVQTGQIMGNYDHATVLCACNNVVRLFKVDKSYRNRFKMIMYQLGLDDDKTYRRLNLC